MYFFRRPCGKLYDPYETDIDALEMRREFRAVCEF